MPVQKRVFASFLASFERDMLTVSPPETIYGLAVFVRRFAQSLLAYSDFDEFHFFTRGAHSPVRDGELLGSDPRVRVRPLHEFSAAAEQNDIRVLHNPWTPDIGPWTDLRNRMCTRSIPVTGMTHTVSYHSFLPRVLLTMMLSPRETDSIVCSSVCGRTVMQNWIGHLSAEFGEHIGRPVRFDGRLDTIPIGVDPDEFRPREKTPLRKRLQLPVDATIVLYLGRFSAYDKMDLAPLLLAFQRASQTPRERPLALVLAGSAGEFEYADEVDRLTRQMGLAGSVHIVRNVAEGDIPAFYAAADIFASPSDNIQETFGQSLIEAMASGLPIVCSDWNGYREIVVPNETGLLIPTYWMPCDRQVSDFAGMSEWLMDHFYLAQSVCVDVERMAGAIELLASNAALRMQMGERARQRALDLYDWRVVIRQYQALWDELNATADKNPSSSRQDRSWYRADLFETFRHYCTQILSDEATVLVNEEGQLARSLMHTGQSPFLQTTLLDGVTDHARQAISVADLQERVTRTTGCSPDEFRFHLLWLFKYDIVRLTTPDRLN